MVKEHDIFLGGLDKKLVIKKEVMRELSAADDDDEIEELLAEAGRPPNRQGIRRGQAPSRT